MSSQCSEEDQVVFVGILSKEQTEVLLQYSTGLNSESPQGEGM